MKKAANTTPSLDTILSIYSNLIHTHIHIWRHMNNHAYCRNFIALIVINHISFVCLCIGISFDSYWNAHKWISSWNELFHDGFFLCRGLISQSSWIDEIPNYTHLFIAYLFSFPKNPSEFRRSEHCQKSEANKKWCWLNTGFLIVCTRARVFHFEWKMERKKWDYR